MASSEQRPVLWVAATACCGLTIGLTAWWAAKKALDTYVPYQYHYRPGTFSGWLAHVLDEYSQRRRSRRPVRVYMDGCFDMMHYGHANALRQAKALGDELVVGLIPDREIRANKGPPVLDEKERLTLVDSVKWVDEIITGVPYDLSPGFIQTLFSKHRIDYVIHGDDPCLLPDGTDAYAEAKRLGRFKMIKRTEGVSTTDIVGRMLTCTRVNPHMSKDGGDQVHPLTRSFSRGGRGGQAPAPAAVVPASIDGMAADSSAAAADGPQPSASSGSQTTAAAAAGDQQQQQQRDLRVGVSRFLPTSRRLVQFSEGKSAPDNATIVYIDGAFDVFHAGHVEVLRLAKEQGDFLLVGLHTDEDVGARRGPHTPIMNVHERALSVLACKYVDEVIIGAPVVISDDLLRTFNIRLVVRGSVTETRDASSGETERYALPQERGIYRRLPSPSLTTTRSIVQRIVDNRAAFEARNAKKVASEAAYYSASKDYVKEV